MVYRVVTTRDVSDDVIGAAAFIRRGGPPLAARRWLKQMRVRLSTLAQNPERCPVAPETESLGQPMRNLLCGSGNRGTYRVIFTIVDEFVIVLHVRHAAMLPLGADELY